MLTELDECGHVNGQLRKDAHLKITSNPHRGGQRLIEAAPFPSINVARASELIARYLSDKETPRTEAKGLADVANLWVKDERDRIGLGSFKALGAATVIARHAADIAEDPDASILAGRTYVTASAGNHGMSVASGARRFGAEAVIYIADTVPESFVERLREQGAAVVREGVDYAASMEAANKVAQDNGWILLSDSS